MTSKGQPFRVLLRILLVVSLSACSLSCGRWNLLGRSRQINTFGRVQEVSLQLEGNRRKLGRDLSQDEIDQAVARVAHGLDAWGHRIRVFSRPAADGAQYAVVSYGRDGIADLADPEAYFTLHQADIRGLFDRDLVYVDGACVTNGGRE